MSLVEIITALLAGGFAAVIGGCGSGLAVGYKKIDTVLAGMMGMFYGALASIGILFGVILLALLH